MADQVSDLHAAIMNLPNQSDCYPDFGDDWHAGFAEGHRDARHTAAELAASHAADVEALRADVERYRWLRQWVNLANGPVVAMSGGICPGQGGLFDAAIDAARAALKGDKP